jgi:eukaryotic-like serine/threonine-protein kinase
MKKCPKCQQKFEPGIVFCPSDGERLTNVEGIVKEDPLIGEVIDNKYLIEIKIAKGGTASVYRARHIQLDLLVALKVMHPHLTTDKTAVERFRREAFAAMHIRHPNAIAILDFSICSDGTVYVVTEFLSGISLRDRILQNHQFSLSEANEVIQQTCAAVAVAHKRGIIHRDLKPDNIFLHQDQGQEVVKVLDFGIAKLGAEQPLNDFSGRLTRHGYVLGTPHYMSPEQCQDKEVDARTDIYALGVVLYEMLTGKVPFNAKNYSAIVYQKVKENPPPMYEIRPDIHPLIDAVVRRALAKKASDRPESMLAFARELELAVRAITEDEFLNVFQNASEHELEAAILLAGEPARNITGHLRSNININSLAGIKPVKTSDLEQGLMIEIAPNTVVNNQTNVESNIQLVDTNIKKEEPLDFEDKLKVAFEDLSLQKTLSDVPLEDESISPTAISELAEPPPILDELPNLHYDELLAFTEDAITLLNQEMANLAKEMVMLLQIVVDDLGKNAPLDKVFFTELRSSVDALRAVMYHMQHFYDQKPN